MPGRHERGSQLCRFVVLLTLCLPLPTLLAQDTGTLTPEKARRAYDKKQYSPYANRTFPTRPLFGDTHLHTGMSLDAGVWGTSLRPLDAYRFARGEQVTSSTGQPVKLSRPLDFLVVTDHSDNIRVLSDVLSANRAGLLARRPSRGARRIGPVGGNRSGP